jgi:hypothetical protein
MATTQGTSVVLVQPTRATKAATILTEAPALPKPETSGLKRGVRMWSGIAKACFWIGAGLTLVSAKIMVELAGDLSSTWEDTAWLTVVALCVSGISPLLLAVAGFMADTRPEEAARIVQAWRWLLLAGVVGAIFLVQRQPAPEASTSPVTADRAADLRASLQTLAPVEWEAWNASKGCAAPSSAWRSICETVTARRAVQWRELRAIEDGAQTWIKAASSPTTLANAGDRMRRVMLGVVALLAWAGAGLVTRMAALTYDDANRRADGTPPAAPAPTVQLYASPGQGPAAHASSMLDAWFRSRVSHSADGWMNATLAYDDYAENMRMNGFAPAGDGVFFNFLAAKAKAMNIERSKRNGKNGYRGWTLGGDADADYSAGLPYD